MCKKRLMLPLALIVLFLLGCANAGKNQTVFTHEIVKLNGSKSANSVKTRVKNYSWEQIEGIKVNLKNFDTASPIFIAPVVDKKILLVFKLTTEECYRKIPCFTSSDIVTITILPKKLN